HDQSPLGREVDDAVALLKARKLKEARDKFQSLQSRVGVDDAQKPRIDSLLEIARLGEQSAAGRLVEVGATGKSQPAEGLTEQDAIELKPVLARLRVELGVMNPPMTKDGWRQRLADCDKAAEWPSDWVEPSRIECLVELDDKALPVLSNPR